jgi:hypothetical protein
MLHEIAFEQALRGVDDGLALRGAELVEFDVGPAAAARQRMNALGR